MAFSHIVVAVDGSPTGEEPLRQAAWLARLEAGARLSGIYVIDAQWADFIGNDWQSSRNARQGFLDYMRQEQEAQAELARQQFAAATGDLPNASFITRSGDPAEIMLEFACSPDTGLLILSRQAFQICGRPSSKGLAQRVSKQAQRPVLLWP